MKTGSLVACAAFIAVSMALTAFAAQAQNAKTPIHIFGSVRCSACLDAKRYLEFVAAQEKAQVTFHDVAASPEAAALAKRVARDLRVSVGSFPLVVIGDRAFVGWSNDEQGPKAAAEIQNQRGIARPDAVAAAVAGLSADQESGGEGANVGWIWPVGGVLAAAVAFGAWALWRRRRSADLPINGQ